MSQGKETARRLVFLGSHVDPCLIQEEVTIPQLKSGEILGKFRMATICGSDLHTISGKRKEAVPRYVYKLDRSESSRVLGVRYYSESAGHKREGWGLGGGWRGVGVCWWYVWKGRCNPLFGETRVAILTRAAVYVKHCNIVWQSATHWWNPCPLLDIPHIWNAAWAGSSNPTQWQIFVVAVIAVICFFACSCFCWAPIPRKTNNTRCWFGIIFRF